MLAHELILASFMEPRLGDLECEQFLTRLD